MLKWVRDYLQWRYTWPYLLVIVVSVGASLLAPHSSQEVQQVANGAANGAADDYLAWLESAQFWGAMATCVIAAFAFFQIRDFRLSSERQLRAYVMVQKAVIHDVETGKRPHATVTLKNFGKTPAYEFKQWANMGYGHFPHTIPFPTKGNPNEPMPISQLGPGGRFLANPRITENLPALAEDGINGLKAGKYAIYVVGGVIYKDAFGVERVTDYVLFAGGPIGIGTGELAPYISGMKST